MRTTTLLAPTLGVALALAALTGVPAHAAATCDGRAATIEVPATAYDTAPVVGTPGNDVIVGTPGRDTIDGAGGNDVICGLGGPDTLAGGEGDDRLFGGLDMEYSIDDGYRGDLVSPGPGNDHVDLGADPAALHIHRVDFGYLDRVVYADATAPVTVDLTAGTATGEGTDTIVVEGPAGVVGSAFGDRITGSPYRDLIQAGDGDDVVDGRGGDDHLVVDGGADTTTSLPALDGGDDVADGGPGTDGLVSSGGTDQLSGDAGNDFLTTSPVTAGSLRGGPGKDRVYAEGPVDVSAGAGKDQIDYVLQPGFRTEIDGDGGRDSLDLQLSRAFGTGEKVRVDRPRNRITFTGSTTRLGYFEVERLDVSGGHPHWTFVGTRADESLRVLGGRSLTAYGRGGDDVFYGTGGRDLLDGGRGRDRANGSSGRDTCVSVERAVSCERRR
ncbi:calcium-binding protein [Nocardioides sp. Soil805]|uniref:calcium-binding protein n=1 Tax=Nocardioides sp. Soil805 TaxID=1736416 RepID=UPI00070348DD|nr:calcium-binding protein [Nocardioides sp. Soil805]KRF37524.1 hypothetical protein ASG94_09490 [Nocardioides sp. Soil805]